MTEGQEHEEDWKSRLAQIHDGKERSGEESHERLRGHEAMAETWISKQLRPALDSLAQALGEQAMKNVSRSGASHSETLSFDVIKVIGSCDYPTTVKYTVSLTVSPLGAWGRAEFRDVKAP
ncbi:MAG: hypothetical protein ISS70_23560 [Phycisphaerae bacterium]|nr:hypothetical protein [Phycisphaerae bacterium]